MKRLVLLFVLLVLCSQLRGEEMFTTFVSKESYAKSDIALKLDEKDVTPDDFLHVDVASRTPSVLSHPAGRRQYILLIDFLYLSPAQIGEVRKLAQDFVNQIPKEDLVALAAITNEDGLRFFSGLTTDRSRLISGWNAMGQVVLSGMTEGPDGNLYPATILPDDPIPELLSDDAFLTNIRAYSVPEKTKPDLAPLYVQAFVDLSSLCSTIDGRKNIVLFSPGTDVKGLNVDLKQSSKKTEKEKTGEKPETDDHKTMRELTQVGPRDLDAYVKGEGEAKRSRANDASVVSRLLEGSDSHVHVIHPPGEENGFLRDLAERTGGTFGSMDQFPGAIASILNSDSSYYVVGWHGEREKDFHELHVLEIRAADNKIDSPTRWLAPKLLSEYSTLERKMRVSQEVYQDSLTSTNYRFWSDVVLDNDVNRISTFTEIPGRDVLAEKAKQASFEFYGFSMDSAGHVKDFYSLPISLDLTNVKLKDRLQRAGLKIWNVLFAGHGPVVVRTIVLNLQTGETVTNSSRVHFKDTDFLISNPFFPSTNFEWIFWPKPDQAQNRRGMEILYPYKFGQDIFVPELSPTLHTQEKGRVLYFKIYNFVPANQYPSVHLRLVDDKGTSVEIEKFGLMSQPRLIDRSGLEVFWKIESLPALTKGNYRFQVDVTDRRQGKEVIRDVDTTVE
jgi:hypothetical protein